MTEDMVVGNPGRSRDRMGEKQGSAGKREERHENGKQKNKADLRKGVSLVILFDSVYRATLAFSVRAVKAAGSWMAISESIFRFISMPASFSPCMKVE